MRIAFVNSTREPFVSAGARARVGSDADNDLVLSGTGIAKRHLAIVEDRRGLVLEVLPSAPHVYVNARPVRERGLLRYGDCLSVGGCKLLLLPDQNGADEAASMASEEDHAHAPGFAALRVVSGAWSGRLLPIEKRLNLGGRGSPLPGIAQACGVHASEDGLFLDAGNEAVMINGRARKRARLDAGDQIVISEHRFVVEAPGLHAQATAMAQARHYVPPPTPIAVEKKSSHTELWWLIGTAALVAALIALMLFWKH